MLSHLLKSLILASLLVLLSFTFSQAETKDLIDYRLSLAGYTLGMSYDDAISMRTLLFIQDTDADPLDDVDDFFDATAEQVFIDGIEMDLWLRFKHERLFKIVARFAPEKTENLAVTFNQTLGPAEDQSKVVPDREGNEIRQTVYYWEYPTARMYLVKISNNKSYATVALTAKPSFTETFIADE